MDSQRRVPQSRLGRLAQLGRLAGGMAGGALSEGARQLGQGRRPSMSDLLISPGNAKRLADRLAEMRGAAMKVGQLLSMESGELMPPELTQALARLRESAHAMPLGQVADVLEQAWGKGWDANFRRFSFKPLAAASIGQVHQAELKDGRRLAIKIQYPGIRRSIDSDVDNVATLLSLVKIVPAEIDLGPLLDEAKRQLHIEADYAQEAGYLRRFGAHLADDRRFEVPEVVDELSSVEVLSMSYLDGLPIETLADETTALRNRAAGTLLELALTEVLDWGLVQTDPNFANYRYQPSSGRLQLLDFGATRDYAPAWREALCDLLRAGVDGDDRDLAQAAEGVGYLAPGDPAAYRSGVVTLLRAVTEPARTAGDFDFGRTDLARRMSDLLIRLRLEEKFGRLPPPEVLFLHRKLGGTYLLLARLGARVPVRDLITPYLQAGERAEAAGTGGQRLAG
jgi:predicted unusual protein kinase regulating ubiquinone biosynthesis (AarF/ABC1/UbiB family)